MHPVKHGTAASFKYPGAAKQGTPMLPTVRRVDARRFAERVHAQL
jgi:hypothetical protein